eukprot:3182303-Pleurochrysis_carterae.AAC.4
MHARSPARVHPCTRATLMRAQSCARAPMYMRTPRRVHPSACAPLRACNASVHACIPARVRPRARSSVRACREARAYPARMHRSCLTPVAAPARSCAFTGARAHPCAIAAVRMCPCAHASVRACIRARMRPFAFARPCERAPHACSRARALLQAAGNRATTFRPRP